MISDLSTHKNEQNEILNHIEMSLEAKDMIKFKHSSTYLHILEKNKVLVLVYPMPILSKAHTHSKHVFFQYI